MRYLTIFTICLIAFSCSTTDDNSDICKELVECTGACEFTLEKQTATTVFLSCYHRWGVLYDGDEYPIGLIIDHLPAEYEHDSMEVVLCGYARTNEIPLRFPDPLVGAVYQFEAAYIQAVE